MNWKEKLADKWWRVKIAERASGMVGINRGRQMTERLVKKTQDGTLGKPTDDPWPSDDMAVNIGDTHNTTPASGNGLWDKAAVLLAAGAIASAPFAWGAIAAFNKPEPPAQVVPAPPPVTPKAAPAADTDSWMELRLGDPPAKQ